MTLKEQVAVRIESDLGEYMIGYYYDEVVYGDTARHILDLVKAHLENGGTLDD